MKFAKPFYSFFKFCIVLILIIFKMFPKLSPSEQDSLANSDENNKVIIYKSFSLIKINSLLQ